MATQLTKGAIVSVSSMARELHGKFGDGNCRVRLFGRGRAVLLARQNLVVETEAADYRDTLLELWPHSIEFGLERAGLPVWRECGCGAGERRLEDWRQAGGGLLSGDKTLKNGSYSCMSHPHLYVPLALSSRTDWHLTTQAVMSRPFIPKTRKDYLEDFDIHAKEDEDDDGDNCLWIVFFDKADYMGDSFLREEACCDPWEYVSGQMYER